MNRINRNLVLPVLALLLMTHGLAAKTSENAEIKDGNLQRTQTNKGNGSTSADGLPVDMIVRKANHAAYYQGRDGRAQVHMVIEDGKGHTRERRLTILRRDDESGDAKNDEICGDQKFYVYFQRPADVNKTAFLVWKHLDRNDDRWLYLPALDLKKRISAGDKRTSFVGSHFFYEDVSGRNINADVHELVETTENYYVLKNTPKEGKTVEFAYFKVWLHRATFIPVRTEYYNSRGEKYREYAALKVETVDGYPTVIVQQMKDLRTGGKTVATYRKVRYNIGLPDTIFTERYLRNPPTRYLR